MEESQQTRLRFSFGDLDGEEQRILESQISSLVAGEPCAEEAGTRGEADHRQFSQHNTVSTQQIEPPACLICLDHEYDDFQLRRNIFNTIRHRLPEALPPGTFSIEEAIQESGLQEIFGPSINNNRDQLVTLFQCPQGAQVPASHFFHLGCIGLHIWTRCLRNEQGRIPLSHIPCPICRAPLDEIISDTANRRDLLSRFPFEGVFDSPTRRFFPFTDNVPAPICFNPP